MCDEPTYSREYFLEEVHRLRDAFGSVDFWRKENAAVRATFALSYVFARVDNPTEFDKVLFESTIDELARRSVLVDLYSKER